MFLWQLFPVLLAFVFSGVSVTLSAKMVYSDYVKQRILFYRRSGKSHQEIALCLAEEGHTATKVGIGKFLK